MRRFLLLVFLMLPAVMKAGEPDRDLILGADFSSKVIKVEAPKDISKVEEALYKVDKQLTGRCYFNPPCYLFFGQAVRELGFVPAVFATSDRILRCTRIGMVLEKFDEDHRHIDEGPEAYRLSKK